MTQQYMVLEIARGSDPQEVTLFNWHKLRLFLIVSPAVKVLAEIENVFLPSYPFLSQGLGSS